MSTPDPQGTLPARRLSTHGGRWVRLLLFRDKALNPSLAGARDGPSAERELGSPRPARAAEIAVVATLYLLGDNQGDKVCRKN